MDDYRTFDNDSKRVVKKKNKKQSKDARNIAVYHDPTIGQAF